MGGFLHLLNSQNRHNEVYALNFAALSEGVPSWAICLASWNESDYLFPKPTIINLKLWLKGSQSLSSSHIDSCKMKSTRRLRRFSSVPLGGLLKTCRTDFLSSFFRTVFLDLKFNFSWNYWIPSSRTNPGTQTARCSKRETFNRHKIVSKKKTAFRLIPMILTTFLVRNLTNLI